MTQYAEEHSTRASDPNATTFPTAYNDKDDFSAIKEKLAKRKKPIYAGLAFLCVVVVGVSIGVSTSGGTEANTQSGIGNDLVSSTDAPEGDSVGGDADYGTSDSGKVSPGSGSVWTEAPVKPTSSAGSSTGSRSGSSSGSTAGFVSNATEPTPAPSPTPEATTVEPTPEPTEAPALPFSAVDFDWTAQENWEYSGGGNPASGMISKDGIMLTPANSAQPIRSKQGWGGEKILLIEWERSASSDTNIWMLNTKITSQFGVGNGWPYYGELDIFEMFTQDASDKGAYDFSGFGGYSQVSSYGQLTLHNGPRAETKQPPCFCPASASKSAWYQNTAPMTSGCTAQFANSPKNSMATVWGTDGNGQYLQLIQNPTVTKGGKKNKVDTYDITTGGGAVTTKIYNNKDLFWGTPASSPCAVNGGHNPGTGFPFFEDFRIILEEQKKSDSSAWFKVTNIQIFKKN